MIALLSPCIHGPAFESSDGRRPSGVLPGRPGVDVQAGHAGGDGGGDPLALVGNLSEVFVDADPLRVDANFSTIAEVGDIAGMPKAAWETARRGWPAVDGGCWQRTVHGGASTRSLSVPLL